MTLVDDIFNCLRSYVIRILGFIGFNFDRAFRGYTIVIVKYVVGQ